MKKILLIPTLVLLIMGCGPSKSTAPIADSTPVKSADPFDYANTINSDELKEMLYVYASDEFEGRDTGSPGQKKAIAFLKKHYVDMNIPSPLGGDDYFQEVPLVRSKLPSMGMTINGRNLEPLTNFISLMTSKDKAFEMDEVLDLGYGIETDGYSNYKGIDVSGKIIFVRSGEPKNEDGTYLISGNAEASKWSKNARQQIAAKRDIAKEKGAKMVFFYFPDAFQRYSNWYGSSKGRISLSGGAEEMYLLMVNDDVAEMLYEGNKKTLRQFEKVTTLDASVSFSYKNQNDPLASENVISFIKGSENPEEYVIISAHLDHVGMNDQGEIYNGADDDGSGNVAILEIAEAFKQAVDNGHGPKRSVVFLHVTGEERGLLGSRYYTDMDPVFPLEQTVANLNIDMIGRIDPKRESKNRNYVYLIGSDKLSTELHDLSEEMNSKYTNIELDYTYNDENDPNRFYYRSDHYNFAKNNIPIIFYFNGTHPDYHKITDTPDKIEYDLLENRTKLIFHTAWEIANRERRISVDRATEPAGSN